MKRKEHRATGGRLAIYLIGTLTASLGWLLSQNYDFYDPARWMLLTAGLAAAVAWCFRHSDISRPTLASRAFVSALYAAIVYYLLARHTCWSVACSCLLPLAALAPGNHGHRYLRTLAAVATAFMILGVQFLLLEKLFHCLQWFTYDIDIFDRIAYPVLSLAGVDCSLGRDGITVFDGRSHHVIHYTLERSHLIWLFRYLLGVAVLYRLRHNARPAASTVAAHAAYAVSHCMIWILLSLAVWNYTKAMGHFLCVYTFMAMDLVTFLLCVPFLAAPGPGALQAGAGLGYGRASPSRAALALACAMLALFGLWYPSGRRSPARAILVDDMHSAWEWSDSAFTFTDESMSKKNAYSYTTLVDCLRYYYEVDVNKDRRLDAMDLGRYSAIVLKTITLPLTDGEIDAVRKYVAAGGGLFLHGDHTNLYGMSNNFNAILEPCGIRFNCDDQADMKGLPTLYRRDARLPAHHTLAGVRAVQFLTSCTIRPRSVLVEPVIVGTRMFSEDAIYGKPGFFGNLLCEAQDRVGCFLQAAVQPYGRGRIAVFADSTVFSNFAVCQSDYLEYALNTLEYIQYSTTGARARVLAVGLLLLGTTLAVAAWRRVRTGETRLPWNAVLYDVPLGVIAGILVAALLHTEGPPPARPRRPVPSVGIVMGHATNKDVLSGAGLSEGEKATDFSAFILCLQRAGYIPKVCRSISEALETGNNVVLINPDRNMRARDVDALCAAVLHDRKHIVLLDSIYNEASTSNVLLRRLGMEIAPRIHDAEASVPVPLPDLSGTDGSVFSCLLKTVDYLVNGDTAPAFPPLSRVGVCDTRLHISGGRTVLIDDRKNAVCAQVHVHGGGSVAVFVDSAVLSATTLGGGFMQLLTESEKESIRNAEALLRYLMYPTTERAER